MKAARNFENIHFASSADLPRNTLSYAVIFSCNHESLSFISKTIFRCEKHENVADEKDEHFSGVSIADALLAIIALGGAKVALFPSAGF